MKTYFLCFFSFISSALNYHASELPHSKMENVEQQTEKGPHVFVVIDVFRAFTTAAYILERNPKIYVLASKTAVVAQLASNWVHPLIIGKPEKGRNDSIYHIPNSPTRTLNENVTDRCVLHRTEAGAGGVLLASQADIILVAGFVNAKATCRFIQALSNPQVTFMPMGHEGVTPSIEDDLCACYLSALLHDKTFDLVSYLPALKEGPGSYFFKEDQWQYPFEDFARCLEIDRFNFAIQAVLHEGHAILIKKEME